MSRWSAQVRDEYSRPVSGVSIYVYKWDALAQVAGDLETLTDDAAASIVNPVISDDDGIYYFNSLDGQKLLELHYGGKVQERELILVGALPVPQATIGGLFINAAALTIPVGMDMVTTTGYSSLDVGAAIYVYDVAVNTAYVAAHPRSSFISLNLRGFRLSLEQDITPEMLGSPDITDDYPAFQAAIDLLPAAGGRITVPAGAYKLLTKPAQGTKTIFWAISPGATFTGAGAGAGNFPTSGVVTDLGLYYRLGGSAWPEKDRVFDDLSHGTALVPIVSDAGTADFFTPFRRSAFLAAGHKGGLQTALFDGQVRGAPDVSSTDPDYTPIQGFISATVNLGGTGLTTGTARGALFGSAFLAVAYPGATNLLNVTGCEFNVQIETGASVAIKTGNQIVQMPDDAVSGTLVDAGLAFSNQVGAIGWNMVLCLSHLNNGQHSVKSTGTLVGVIGTPSCAKGIDLSGVTFSGNAIATPGWTVGPTGAAASLVSLGYGTGAGAAVTQLTNKSTATPAINKPCGQITMNNAALAGGAKVSFVVTNSTVAATDTIIVSVASGGTANAYRAAVTAISAGVSFTVTVENITAGSLSEAPVINFAILKAVAA